MLSEETLEKLIQPLIARQENINNWVIKQIAQRIKEIGKIMPSDVYKLERLLKTGSNVRKINKEIARITGLQEIEIKSIIKTVAADIYKDAKPFYDYRKKPYITFSENTELQRIVKAISNQTAETFKNISKAQAFMIRDLKNPKILKPTPIAEAYQSVIDEAVQASTSGILDYNTAMARTIQQLTDSGMRRVTYDPESGKRYTQRLDTAVRRNILDGIRAISQEAHKEIGKQVGTDGFELSVHNYPAPDHAPVQGHQFTNAEYKKMQNGENFQDVNGNKFIGFDRSIGVLNCRHFAYAIILGVEKPNYTEKQLKEILAANEKGFTLPNGKNLTMYECTQKQREMETKIRRAKDGQIAAVAAGNEDLAKKYQAKVTNYLQEYRTFSAQCGLSVKYDKINVQGYKAI